MEERKGLHSLVSNVPWCSWSHLKTHRVVHKRKQTNELLPLVKEAELTSEVITDPHYWPLRLGWDRWGVWSAKHKQVLTLGERQCPQPGVRARVTSLPSKCWKQPKKTTVKPNPWQLLPTPVTSKHTLSDLDEMHTTVLDSQVLNDIVHLTSDIPINTNI